jgi:hypothetical protein
MTGLIALRRPDLYILRRYSAVGISLPVHHYLFAAAEIRGRSLRSFSNRS